MGFCSRCGLGLSEARDDAQQFTPACESESAGNRVIASETSESDSDAYWIAMMRREYRPTGRSKTPWGVLQGSARADLRCDEMAEADRKAFLSFLRKSYAKRADTLIWSIMVLTIATFVLVPLLGFHFGLVVACLVGLCWSAVHWVRRL